MAFKPVIKPTLSNLNTRTGVGQNQHHFQYWADGLDLDWDLDKDDFSAQSEYYLEKVMQLAALRRATSNFVGILTGDDKIHVEYSSGKDSYTDGKTVVISAEDDPTKFDKTVAIALHEASHCLLTDFHFGTMALKLCPSYFYPYDMREWKTPEALSVYSSMITNVVEDRRIDEFVYRTAVGYRPYYDVLYNELWHSPEISKALRIKKEWQEPTWEAYMDRIINMSNPVGYETRHLLPGMDEIYKIVDLAHIRRLDNDPVSYRGCESQEWFKGVLVKKVDHHAIPTDWYEFVVGRDDHPKIREEYLPELWKITLRILRVIHQHIEDAQNKSIQKPSEKSEQDGSGGGSEQDDEQGDEQGEDGDANSLSNLPNLDNPGSTSVSVEPVEPKQDGKKTRLTKAERAAVVNEKKLEKELEKIRDFINGENKKKKIEKKIENDVQAMDSAQATVHHVGNDKIGRGRVLVTEQITDAIVNSEWFTFTRKRYNGALAEPWKGQVDAIQAGVRMGQILAHRLQVRNEQTVTKFPNQPAGNIDRRMLARLGMELENVFSRSVQDQFKPALIHLSLDASGSMYGEPWKQVTVVATAMAYAATKIHNLDVVVSIRGEVHGDRGMAHMAIIHDSRKNTFAHFRKYMGLLAPNGSTPEGLCFEAILEDILKAANDYSVYFVNLSDGQPGFTATPTGQAGKKRRRYSYNAASVVVAEKTLVYDGLTAWRHTRHQINKMREVGIKVLSYFVQSGGYYNRYYQGEDNAFRIMYGDDASFIKVSEVTGIVTTMNKLLLRKN